MKKLIVLLLIISITTIVAQENYESFLSFSSLNIITDASSIALGEASVANKFSISSFASNPAALSIQKGVNTFYNYRSLNWSNFIEKAYFFSVGAQVFTPIGNFSAALNQFSILNQGETQNDKVFTLTYSRSVIKNLTVGISAKYFNRYFSGTAGEKFETTPALLFDFGLLYNLGKVMSNEIFSDDLNLGLSIQNFGTDYRESFAGNPSDLIVLPRFLRAGFCYQLNLFQNRMKESDLEILLTTEYTNLLNTPDYLNDSRDQWAGGIEALIFKVISLRYGGILSPDTNIFFERGKIVSRYGFGVQFPFERLGLEIPITIKFDYSPLKTQGTDFLNNFKKSNSLDNYSISLCLNRDLF